MRCFPNLILSRTLDICILLTSFMWMNLSMTHLICFATHTKAKYTPQQSAQDPQLENTFQQQVCRQMKQIIGYKPFLKSQLQLSNDPPSLCKNDVCMTVLLPGYTKDNVIKANYNWHLHRRIQIRLFFRLHESYSQSTETQWGLAPIHLKPNHVAFVDSETKPNFIKEIPQWAAKAATSHLSLTTHTGGKDHRSL